jgi:predicted ATPase
MDNPQFEEGAFLVALALVRQPSEVVSTIASTLGLRDTGREPLALTLRDHLRNKRLLLLLDNMEQVVSAAPLVVDLLERAPGLKIVVTSREPLYVRGERQLTVPPLALPGPDLSAAASGRRPATQPENLIAIPSIALFMERAREVAPGFVLTPDNAEPVAAICRHLQGVPLAIELVAAWVRLLPPHALLQRLQGRPAATSPVPPTGVSLDMLAGGTRDLPPRHRALRDAIGWSYDLLSHAERTLFARLGLFVGGCTLGAAEAVCNAVGDLPFSVLAGLSSLLDKSLLQVRAVESAQPGAEIPASDEPRYFMLETIRQYAEERMRLGGDEARIREWFTQYYLALAQEFKTRLMSADQKTWVARLDIEHDNMRSAFRMAIDAGNIEAASNLLLAIFNFWYMSGHVGEGRAWLEEACSHPARHRLPDIVQAELLTGAGFLASAQYDLAQAARRLDEALSISRRTGDREKIALALNAVGTTETQRGRYPQAEAALREARAIFVQLDQGRREGVALYNLALIALFTGDASGAENLVLDALPLLRRGGDDWNCGLALCALGFALCRLGQFDRASRACDDAASAFATLSASNLGHAIVHACRAEIARCRGDLDSAASLFKESLHIDRETSSHRIIAQTLLGLGLISSASGHAEVAATFFGILHGWSERLQAEFVMPADRLEFERALDSARRSLHAERWSTAWERGRAMTLDQAIDFALDHATTGN